MRSRSTTLTIALAIGVVFTIVLSIAAEYTHGTRMESVARMLSWANTLLQSFVPCYDMGNGMGSIERPYCEATALNVLAYVASYPLSITVYAAIAYFILRRR